MNDSIKSHIQHRQVNFLIITYLDKCCIKSLEKVNNSFDKLKRLTLSWEWIISVLMACFASQREKLLLPEPDVLQTCRVSVDNKWLWTHALMFHNQPAQSATDEMICSNYFNIIYATVEYSTIWYTVIQI